MAVQAGVELVTAKETRATLTLKEPTGGARAPLQKQLGTGVDVGHMQIRVEIGRDDPEWIDELMAVLDQLKMFQERMAQMMEMVMAAERGDETVIAAVSETVG